MMQRPNDEQLIAFLDGEVDENRFAEIEGWLDRDPALRDRLAALTQTTLLVRDAFDEVLHEAVPARLLAAAKGKTGAKILSFRPRFAELTTWAGAANSRWWGGMAAAAASVALIMLVSGTGGYLIAGGGTPFTDAKQTQVAASGVWLDNIAGYHNLFISDANSAENTVFDVPAGAEKRLPVDVQIPDLKPWGLNFQGARKLVSEGKPAFQFYYTTDNQKLGPVSVMITTTARPDIAPTLERRDNVNLLYWRHGGHGYAIIGQADKGYMWGLSNDIAYQLKAD